MLTIATANVNGIRAAFRRGMEHWLDTRQPDVLLLQEVRASDEILDGLMGDGWHIAHQACDIKGRAGVAVASRLPVDAVRVGLAAGPSAPADSGRWVETDIKLSDGSVLTAISVYVHKGDIEEVKQAPKYAFLDAVTARLRELHDGERQLLMGGDLNIAHRQVDLRNWRGNIGRPGCMPREREYLDVWFDDVGLVDVGRQLGGEGPGPYTWWTWRGQAYDNDAGWRIDYQVASPAWAGRALKAEVDRAESYAQRWSDHAAMVVTYRA